MINLKTKLTAAMFSDRSRVFHMTSIRPLTYLFNFTYYYPLQYSTMAHLSKRALQTIFCFFFWTK